MQWDQVSSIQKQQPFIYDGFTGAFASFFQTGNPDAHKLTTASQPGVPESWLTNKEFVIEGTGFANVDTSMLEARCSFWKSVADEIPI